MRPEAIKLGIGSENGKEGSGERDIEEKLVSRFPSWGAPVISERTNSTLRRREHMRGLKRLAEFGHELLFYTIRQWPSKKAKKISFF